MKTILVMAPHPDLADSVRSALSAELYRVVHRSDGEDSEPFLEPGAIDLAVIDVEMAHVLGLWLVEKIRRRLPGCPIIVYTGTGPWEWEEEAYVNGVSHVLSKPLRPRMLTALVERIWAAQPIRVTSRGPVVRRPRPNPAPANPLPLEKQPAATRSLEILRDFSGVLTHSLCAEAMLKQFLLMLREILGVNRSAIFLRASPGVHTAKSGAQDSGKFRSACVLGLSADVIASLNLSTQGGIGEFLHREGRILRRDSIEVEDDSVLQKEFEMLGAQVVIPILDRETLVGIAAFDGRITGEPLGNDELGLVFHLLEQLGLAIRNIWLHDQLAANHEMMTEILCELSSACVVVRRDLTVVHSNKTARGYFAKAGKRGQELEFNDLPQELGSKVYQVLKTGTAIAPFRFQPPDSAQTAYHVSVVPFRREEGATSNTVLLMVEDHSQSEQLQRLELETVNLRLIRSMADRLAHEIGNAMVPLSTHQQLLGEKYKDPEFRSSLNVAMADGVKRVSRLLNQMRFLARDVPATRDPVPLAPLLEEAYQEAQKQQPIKSGKLLLDAGVQPAVVAGDRAALRHAFSEVLLNALQANPADAKVFVRVQIEEPQESKAKGAANGKAHGNGSGPALQIDIQDNGTGFSADALENAGQLFFTTRNVGLGLGMTVSRKIIETHHGHLTILTPKPGQSGIVRISLPAAN
ncbi:MAG: response regulator [Pedosphaera sp.]|nr:response regulator [Pedosphaera sp.]